MAAVLEHDDVGLVAEDLLAQIDLEALHHGEHRDQHGHADGHADDGEHRDERDARVLPARSQVRQRDLELEVHRESLAAYPAGR